MKDYSAKKMGYHKFHKNLNPNASYNPNRFIMLWQYDNDVWKITRVIYYIEKIRGKKIGKCIANILIGLVSFTDTIKTELLIYKTN